MLYGFNLEEALRNLATALDIPPELYEAAVLHYTDVAGWLSAEDSRLVQYDPEIYPQGSFRLGTMVRPIFRPDEFDIDLVCRLIIPKEQTTQAALKKGVGSRLREDAKLAEILEEQRRCWRLQYPGQFHLDVLPAIPNAEGALESILLTDKELTRWQHSNPIEYANWFFAKMGDEFLEEERQTIAKAAGVTVVGKLVRAIADPRAADIRKADVRTGARSAGTLSWIEPASGAAVLGVPGDPGFGTVQQGYLENSNVDPVKEITGICGCDTIAAPTVSPTPCTS